MLPQPHLLRTALALLLLALAGNTAGADIRPKIVGGDDAGDGAYPFMAALVRSSLPSDYDAAFCGGTVIAARWVLTAAHCVTGRQVSSIGVITGVTTLSDDPDAGAPRTAVAAVVRHPDYVNSTLLNDIALLYLATPVATDATFAIDDGTLLATLNLGDALTAIGWGALEDTTPTPFPQTLQEVVLDYIPLADCRADYYDDLDARVFCAGYLAAPPRDTCYGDSGGPLLHDGGTGWRQLGITSYGDPAGCAAAGKPGVYTDVGQFADWVDGQLNRPDLRVTLATVGSSGRRVDVRITVANRSPAVDGGPVTLSLTPSAGVTVLTTGLAPGCDTSGCALDPVPAGTSVTRDFSLQLVSPEPYTLRAAAATAGGDANPADNSTTQAWTLTGGGGGSLAPAGILGWLLLLARHGHRRRRAGAKT